MYHPQFAGSCSIKDVLPAVVPEMSYEDMQDTNGQDAGLAWESLVHTGDGAEVSASGKFCSLLPTGYVGAGEGT